MLRSPSVLPLDVDPTRLRSVPLPEGMEHLKHGGGPPPPSAKGLDFSVRTLPIHFPVDSPAAQGATPENSQQDRSPWGEGLIVHVFSAVHLFHKSTVAVRAFELHFHDRIHQLRAHVAPISSSHALTHLSCPSPQRPFLNL